MGIVFTEKEIVAGACNAPERGHDVDAASYKLTLRNVPLSSFWLRPRTNRDVIPRKKRCKNASLTAPFVPIFIYCLRKLISISGGELFFCPYVTDKKAFTSKLFWNVICFTLSLTPIRSGIFVRAIWVIGVSDFKQQRFEEG